MAPSELHQSVVEQVRTRIGATLKGQWRLDALIGIGGMAAVYAATNATGERVAIKMLHPALSMNEAVRKRFAREGYVANTIGHPGVARVLDDGVGADGSAFIVMELLEGETVAARAARLGGKLPVHEVAFVGEAIADVLAAAHAARVIHRDIKPENVFITTSGRIALLDFGIARAVDAAGVSDVGTRTGTMMGTPAFMPPEQARGRANEMDATSDVWALGSTLFWLASGRVVHVADTPNEQLVAAATLPAASLGRVAPTVPMPLVQVIDKALEFAKENRFKDAVAMKHALHEAITAISWGRGTLPSLSEFATLPPARAADRSLGAGQGLTMGPVVVGDAMPSRATMLVKAAVIGALVACGVLGGIVLAVRHAQVAEAPETPAPVVAAVSVPSVATASPPPQAEVASAATSAVPPTSATSAATQAHTMPAATPRTNWLDRRK